MGQVTLGLRSLAIKLAIFFVMAALLAWALGGTLWPRPEVVEFAPVRFAEREWYWQLTVGRRRPEPVQWRLMAKGAGDDEGIPIGGVWQETAGPLLAPDGLFFAGRTGGAEPDEWHVMRIDRQGTLSDYPMPDRLAVEQQLSRLAAGLPLQDESTIRRERGIVLQPPLASSLPSD